jgi:thiamine-monophosphate kinase
MGCYGLEHCRLRRIWVRACPQILVVVYDTIALMDKEHYVINRLRSPVIGDDAAVLGDMLYSMDAFFEGSHFRREWMSIEQIARKAMLVNLSDAIAMNARPRYALVTLCLPRDIFESQIDCIVTTLEQTASEYGCEIIGGDTIGGEQLHFSITIISQSDVPLLRRGLKPGDLLAYTGVLGESRRDLRRLMRGEHISDHSRFIEPTLRAGFIKCARPYLRAGMDISDGLYCDTNKLLEINAMGCEVLMEVGEEIGMSGEEYEMLVGFDPQHLGHLEKIARETKTPLTVFARVVSGAQRYPCTSHHFG